MHRSKMTYEQVKKELMSLSDEERAKSSQRFFKTGKGEYGEGDVFLGITVPLQRKIAKTHINISSKDIKKLLNNKYHECRLTGLLILVLKYKKSKSNFEKKSIVNFYLKNTKKINNWDLVDSSAHYILGDYLLNQEFLDYKVLKSLAKSENLWEKRIAIMSTFAFIKSNKFEPTLKISEILIKDEHDLIHKAVGWMLREIGNKDKKTEEEFLDKYSEVMPRTMLRYAIEKFSKEKRKYYMKK